MKRLWRTDRIYFFYITLNLISSAINLASKSWWVLTSDHFIFDFFEKIIFLKLAGELRKFYFWLIERVLNFFNEKQLKVIIAVFFVTICYFGIELKFILWYFCEILTEFCINNSILRLFPDSLDNQNNETFTNTFFLLSKDPKFLWNIFQVFRNYPVQTKVNFSLCLLNFIKKFFLLLFLLSIIHFCCSSFQLFLLFFNSRDHLVLQTIA